MTRITLQNFTNFVFILGWYVFSASIPVSKFTTSLGIILMSSSWFLMFNWKEKLSQFKQYRWLLLATTSVFLIFVLGLIHSENFKYAFKDIGIKIPILALPILFATGRIPKRNEIIIAIGLLCASAITASLIGYLKYYDVKIAYDPRELSPFISHIRLSLILCFAIGYSFWLWMRNMQKWYVYLLIIPCLWILYFVNIMGNLTALALLIAASLILISQYIYQKMKRLAIVFGSVCAILLIAFLIQLFQIQKLVFKEPDPSETYPTLTYNNNPYTHNKTSFYTENGHYTWRNLCEKEIKTEWQKVSEIPYDTIINNFEFRYVIIRYMTSLGLKKDSLNFQKLNQADITAMEKLYANAYYKDHQGYLGRIHKVFDGLKNKIRFGSSNGNSTAMRLEFWQVGWEIFKNNPLIGVGTGDIKDTFQNYYNQLDTNLDPRYRKRSHNQYLTVGATLGIIGLLIFLWGILAPFYKYQGSLKFLYQLFLLIFLGSMLWEDTIETQAGVAFFTLLNSMFLFENENLKQFINLKKQIDN